MTAAEVRAQLLRPLLPRDPREEHRVASPLELLTDLCVMVAVAQAASGLHHGLLEAHPGHAVLGYAMSFFAISWAWLTFTWFGSAYDNDDVVYRLLTILQILGVLVLAAGIHGISEGRFVAPVTGYLIMRVGLIVQWLRAARHDPDRRVTCLRYAVGTAVVQAGWVGYIWVAPHESLRLPAFAILVLAELAVPMIAERAGITPWHPHHIAERYSLFFIIVLGETIAASTTAVQQAFAPGAHGQAQVVLVMVSGVLIVFSLWWTYFGHEAGEVLAEIQGISNLRAYAWGFGHLVIFASAAAIGSGIAVRVEFWAEPEQQISERVTAAAITVPVAVLFVALWLIQLRAHDGSLRRAAPLILAVVLVLAATLLPYPELLTGVVLAALVATQVIRSASLHSKGGRPP